jgi:hypothetical protein
MERNNVTFDLPSRVNLTDERLDGAKVTVEYDSKYNAVGETVTVEDTAEIIGRGDYFTDIALLVDGRCVGPNGHVFGSDGRHIGRDATVTATLNRDDAIDMVTEGMSFDVDDPGLDEIIVQAWDNCVIEEQGFMAGTDEIRMQRV